jgi:hypothetical protein
MDDFYAGLVSSLEQAKNNKERLLKELEVTDFLIQAQEQALSLYGTNGHQPAPKKQRARRGDKTGVIIQAIRAEIFGLTKDELFDRVKEHDIDRNYLSKILFRLKKADKIREEDGRLYPV